MTPLSRILLALALAVWVAVPGVGSDGGENAGGTGVWILPRAASICAFSGPPREMRTIPAPLAADCTMQMSVEIGSAVALGRSPEI